jgi:hypothetical protein
MITLSELLQDKKFKEYFLDAPRSMPGAGPLPWRVWAQREVDGSWGKKDFPTYVEAFKFLKPKIGQWHNAALASRAVAYGPRLFTPSSAGGERQSSMRKQASRRASRSCGYPSFLLKRFFTIGAPTAGGPRCLGILLDTIRLLVTCRMIS